MSTNQTSSDPIEIPRKTLLSIVSAFGGLARPDDDNPFPPGPWDPIIRAAVERVQVFGPWPEPWRGSFRVPSLILLARRFPQLFELLGGGPGGQPGDEASLNPQPLPPRAAFASELARTAIHRFELLRELSSALHSDAEERGIIIVSGYVTKFVDEICGNDFRFRWPFPSPRPNWFKNELGGLDLVVMAAQFEEEANATFHKNFQRTLGNASARLAEAGVARLQNVS